MMGKKIKFVYLIMMDVILINLSFYIALFLRFEGDIPTEYFYIYFDELLILTLIKIFIFYTLNLYNSLWKYASIEELIQIVLAVTAANIVVLSYMLIRHSYLTWSVYILILILDTLFIGASRLSYRFIRKYKSNSVKDKRHRKIRTMVIGAGDAGASLIKELKNNPKMNYEPVAIIDDDEKKEGSRINGVPVLGHRFDIASVAEKKKIDEIIIAIPSISKKGIRDIIKECKRTECKLKTLPGICELVEGKVTVNQIRDIQIEDLLGREQIEFNIEDNSNYMKGKKILVTGGGGSIGSELCRQIVRLEPKELYILDAYENNAYDLQNELKTKHKSLCSRVVIASVRDRERIIEVMDTLRPHVIFHAAAHKHVTLMEENPKEAIKNNVFGTLNVAQAASKYGVDRFVMISTDKAVNPSSLMGASKRIGEVIIQAINTISKTKFIAVRFGNVLGSNGSVIPLFKKQITEGASVTVTHKDATRYFMTISEAVQLVIQAGAMAQGGEIYILDMGEPVKIINLAEDLIKLSGFEPYEDIPIEITGLKPGEKLREELVSSEEETQVTKHEKIFVCNPTTINYEILLKQLEELKVILASGTDEELKNRIIKIVTSYSKREA